MVGGRSYNQSQYNRAVAVAPAAGIGLQAVRLPRGVRAGAAQERRPTSRRPRSSTTSRRRSSSTTRCGRRRTTRTNTTGRSRCRRALAHSRNLGDDQVARAGRLRPAWRRCGSGSASARRRRPYPSIALGVFEATPLEIATAYTLFPNGGVDPAAAAHRCRSRAAARTSPGRTPPPRRPSRGRETTYLVTNMMRSVLNEGTGAGARGRRLHARRRGQDRHDQRPARRLVRRLHAGAAHGGVGRVRRQPAASA